MDNDLSGQLAEGATLIVDDRLAALQLEAFLARTSNDAQRAAWRSPRVMTRTAWAADLWAAGPADRLLLSAAQSEALWLRVIGESAAGDSLINKAQTARWAREAWRLLSEWQIDFRGLRARDDDPGYGAFLGWARAYGALLEESGWIDAAVLGATLGRSPTRLERASAGIVWTDLTWPTPAIDALTKSMQAAGRTVRSWCPGPVAGSVRTVALADAREEIWRALAWGERLLQSNPRARIALVLPPGVDRDSQIQRYQMLASAGPGAGGEIIALEAEPIAGDPAIAAAVDCLELFTREAGFETFSRWLRSPFIGGAIEGLPARSLIETEWRTRLAAQLDFPTAYRDGGLERWLSRRAPQLAAGINDCMQQLAALPHRQTPTRWAHDAESLLRRLGWADGESPVPSDTLDAWHAVLGELARLTPVLGPIDFTGLISALKRTLARTSRRQPVPLTGIVLLSRPEQLGAGYDAAWIAGMTDRAWPRPAAPNPLLPVRLQAVHAMPWATPGDSLSRCRAITDRVVGRVADLVLSYPQSDDDFAAEPSPLVAAFDRADAGALPAARQAYGAGPTAGTLETRDDPAPAFMARTVPGGAGTLELQARCPLRAFIETRLEARPLEPVARGLGPRERGILIHRALELIYAHRPTSEQLRATEPRERRAAIERCLDGAVAERMRGARRPFAALLALEQERLAPLLESLIAADLERGTFAIEALERREVVVLGGFEFASRVDRIDRLEDGSRAVIDYKTGRRANPADWFRSRLLQPQLPLYVTAIDHAVRAVVFGVVRPGSVGYKGYWAERGAFAGRHRPLPSNLDWAAQRGRWTEQLESLVAEYVRGDTRCFLDQHDAAAGAFAPLTRIYAQPGIAPLLACEEGQDG